MPRATSRSTRSPASSGQGHETSFAADRRGRARRAARAHPLSQAAIRQRALVGNGTGGSRSLAGQGSSFKVLGEQLIELGRPHAARMLECAGAGYGIRKRRRIAVKGTDRAIGFFDLARRLSRERVAGGADARIRSTRSPKRTSGATFPNGCHIAEVEIDPATGVTTIVQLHRRRRCRHAHLAATGRRPGARRRGARHRPGARRACVLRSRYGAVPVRVVHGLHHAARGLAAGRSNRIDYPVPTPTNLLGAKGVGESGCSGSLPSLAECDARCAAAARRRASRHAAHPGAGLGG